MVLKLLKSFKRLTGLQSNSAMSYLLRNSSRSEEFQENI